LSDHDKILRAAILINEMNELERGGASASEVDAAGRVLLHALDAFDNEADLRDVCLAEKLMSGRGVDFSTDNPASLKRVLELARRLGAEVHSFEGVDGMTRVFENVEGLTRVIIVPRKINNADSGSDA
jgi:hypothetical protein